MAITFRPFTSFPLLASPAAATASARGSVAPRPGSRRRSDLTGAPKEKVPRVNLPLGPEGHGEVAEAGHGAGVVVAQGVLSDLESAAVELFCLRKLALFFYFLFFIFFVLPGGKEEKKN